MMKWRDKSVDKMWGANLVNFSFSNGVGWWWKCVAVHDVQVHEKENLCWSVANSMLGRWKLCNVVFSRVPGVDKSADFILDVLFFTHIHKIWKLWEFCVRNWCGGRKKQICWCSEAPQTNTNNGWAPEKKIYSSFF